MISWRTIVGLVFLLGGAWRMYVIMNNKVTGTPLYAEIGCVVWMLVGLYLIIKGMTNKTA